MQGITVVAGLVFLGLTFCLAEAQGDQTQCRQIGASFQVPDRSCRRPLALVTPWATESENDQAYTECKCILLIAKLCRRCRKDSTTTTTQAPETTTQLPETTTQLPETTTQLPETTTQLAETTTLLPETTTQLPETTAGGTVETTSLDPPPSSIPVDGE